MGKRIERIGNALEQVILSRIKSKNIFAEYYNRTERKAQWKRQVTSYSAKEIKDWKLAVMAFTDPENPRAGEWMRFRQSLLLDNHLASIIDTRILRVIRSSYKLVNEKGEENEVLKELLERPWHDELIRLVIGKLFNGRTLIELFDLDENGELVRVTEIPQSNFIPQKGIIIKDEFDTTGVSYVDGVYKDYYLQVGSDWEIGMLNELAMIVLAKKLGLGSWMSYIDTLGVPPIFAITERMDTTRRDELFDMLTDFRSNRFAVLQGNEKIEVPDYNSDAYNSFLALGNMCDNQMTKRVLGGTALTDEKAFVGTANIQERMMQDRYESDKQLYKYIFNQFVRQRLAKISSVYADFASYKLVWDNQETLNILGYIDAVQKLSTAFEFDHEEISKRTGLPIIGTKSITASPAPEPDPQKKKPDGKVSGLKMPLLYGIASIPEVSARTWDDATERLANDIWNGKVKPSDLDRDLVLKNYATLSKAAETGWGKEYYDNDKARLMRENLIRFTGYKTYNLMSTIEAGKKGRTKEEFIEHAKKVVNLHNETYLNVERNFTSAKASAARDWQRYEKDMDIYPNLKLRTMEDPQVRPEHDVLDGLVKKVKDWTEIPPFDPGCRCRLEQTTEPVSAHIPTYQFSEGYANNPGISGEVFTDQHSYLQKVGKGDRAMCTNNLNIMKQFAPYRQAATINGKSVFVSDFYDSADFKDNLAAAKKIADTLSTDVYIRPHIASSSGVKNPELGVGKSSDLADLKTFSPMVNSKPVKIENFLANRLRACNDQGCKYAVLDLSHYKEADLSKILRDRLRGSLIKFNKSIEGVIVIKGAKVSRISRKQIKGNDFKGFIEGLQ